MPQVETSSIKRDLYRRDFTINTLAVHLNPDEWGRLIDFFGGARDIKDRVIRVLHNLAFVEDPTRILRAVRFASRFNFSLNKHTMMLIKGALKISIFDRVEGKRLLNELIHILDERNPSPAVEQLSTLGILDALCPGLTYTQKTSELVDSVSGVLSWWKYLYLEDEVVPWKPYFLALTDSLDDRTMESLAERLSVPRPETNKLLKERREFRWVLNLLERQKLSRRSEIVLVLEKFSMESLLFMLAKAGRESMRRVISEFIIGMRNVKPIMTGKNLKEMGYEPGPVFGSILNSLREARLDGTVTNFEEEKTFVQKTFPHKKEFSLSQCASN